MDIDLVVKITARAWALPILSNLHAGVPGKQAVLLAATGASRTAFAQSMDHLIEIGLLERNPGHGHLRRPEFRLTRLGKSAAEIARKIQSVASGEDLALLRRMWTVPILTSLHQPRHFNDIKRNLRTITDRALSQSLKSMEDRNWVGRSINVAARPPRSIYCAVSTGELISNVTGPEISFGDQ